MLHCYVASLFVIVIQEFKHALSFIVAILKNSLNYVTVQHQDFSCFMAGS